MWPLATKAPSGPLWACLGFSGALGLIGPLWASLVVSLGLSGSLGVSGASQGLSRPLSAFLGLFGSLWASLGLSGPLWAFLGLSGFLWPPSIRYVARIRRALEQHESF